MRNLDEFSSFRTSLSQKDSIDKEKRKAKHYMGFLGDSCTLQIPCIDIYFNRILDPFHTDEGGKIPHSLKTFKKIESLKTKKLILLSSKIFLTKDLMNHGVDLNFKRGMKFNDWGVFNRYAYIPLLIECGFSDLQILHWSKYVKRIRATNFGPLTPNILMQLHEEQIEFIKVHQQIFGDEGRITPKTHDRLHFTEQGLSFGPGINTRSTWGESKFIDYINNSKESRRNQINAVTNTITNNFVTSQLDPESVLQVEKDNSFFFSKNFLSFIQKTKKFPKGQTYKGSIQTTFIFENNNTTQNSLKWLYIFLKNKRISLSPEEYSSTNQTRDHFIKVRIGNIFYFAIIKCIKSKEEIFISIAKKKFKRNGKSVINLSSGLFSYVKFDENCIKVSSDSIVSKANAFYLKFKKYYYITELD